MATSLYQIFDHAQSSVLQNIHQLTKGPVCTTCCGGPVPDNFWVDIGIATQKISTEVTNLTLVLSQRPSPDLSAAKNLVDSIESAWQTLWNAIQCAPVKGSLLRKELRAGVLHIGEALTALLNALKNVYMPQHKANGEQQHLELTGCVQEACAALHKLPQNNLSVVCSLLSEEELLLTDTLEQFEADMKCDRQLNEADVDNTSTWTNQDRELFSPSVSLIRTARKAIRKVRKAVRASNVCEQHGGAQSLDTLVAAAEKLSPAVDEFINSMFPPVNKASISAAALEVVTAAREFLESARQSLFIVGNEEDWLMFLLRTVDKNNNKFRPLLLPN